MSTMLGMCWLAENAVQEDVDNQVNSEGFWLELFLLNPDRARLQQRLDNLRADDLLHLQVVSWDNLSRGLEADHANAA